MSEPLSLNPPAAEWLELLLSYIWEKRGDELWATAIYALEKDGGRATHRDPGQHTSGPEQYFYPLQP